VGPALFFSLLIITLSFLPVFTLVPVLMGYLIRGRILPEQKNPLNRLMTALYRPFLGMVLKAPGTVMVLGLVVATVGMWPVTQLGSEFMPDLDEGDLMYMPTTFPGVSAINRVREQLFLILSTIVL